MCRRYFSWLVIPCATLCLWPGEAAAGKAAPISSPTVDTAIIASESEASGSWILEIDEFKSYVNSPEPLQRDEFIIALAALNTHLLQRFENEKALVDTHYSIQENAALYLITRVLSERDRAQRLLTESRDLLDKKTISKTSNQANINRFQSRKVNTAIAYTDTLFFFQREFNVIFSSTDGSFEPHSILTQGEFVNYLDQIFSEENLSMIGPLVSEDFSLRMASRDLEQAMDAISNNLASIEQQLQILNAATDSLAQAKGLRVINPKHNSSNLAQVISIGEVSDVTPDDAVYEPLRLIIDGYGIDVTQAGGRFNGSSPLTQGDFVTYLQGVVDPIFFYFIPETEGSHFGHRRAIEDLQLLEAELEQVEYDIRTMITEVNQALPIP